MRDPYAEFEEAELENGLKVYAAYWPGRPWEAMGFQIHSGAEHDPVGLEGLAHFVEHLVSCNTEKKQKDIENFFSQSGGMLDLGATSFSYTRYRFFIPIKKRIIEKALSIFGRMLLSAKIENFIEKERRVVIGEFHQQYPIKFQFELDLRAKRMLYKNFWLERYTRPFGNPESVNQINQADLQNWYDSHYTPANISIVGVGGLKVSELVSLLEQSPFSLSKKGERTFLPIPLSELSPPAENHYIFEVSKHVEAEDVLTVFNYLTLAKLPLFNKAASEILDEMLEEIVCEEIRERRAWNYGNGVERYNFRHFEEFSLKCLALNLSARDKVEEIIEKCILSIGKKKDLFKKTKRSILANIFMEDITAKSLCNGAMGDLSENHRIISLSEYEKKIRGVEFEDVTSLLHWLQPEKRWTCLIVP